MVAGEVNVKMGLKIKPGPNSMGLSPSSDIVPSAASEGLWVLVPLFLGEVSKLMHGQPQQMSYYDS